MEKLTSDQNFVPHFLFLTTDTLAHPRLSLTSFRKNTSSNQNSHCKSCLELVFLRSEIRERPGRG